MEKTIQINPDFLQSSRRKYKRKKSGNKEHSLKANDIKKKLLEKIKEHQIKSQQVRQKKQETEERKTNIDDEFKMSLDYLNTVSKEKKEKRKRRRKQKGTAKTQPVKKNLKDDPPYGILKGGAKPLYRDYIKTLKKKPDIEIKTEQKITIHDKNNVQENNTERQKKLKKFRKKIRKRNFTIGKDLKRRRVGVLIKNKTIKKIIEEQKMQLKKKHIHIVKKNLRFRGLIRIGTAAPEDVIRTMYEDAAAAGDIFNRSPEVLLYNYLNDK